VGVESPSTFLAVATKILKDARNSVGNDDLTASKRWFHSRYMNTII